MSTVTDAPVEKLDPVEVKESDAQPDDIRHWSVTTIIGALDKPALVPWAALETARAAVEHRDAWSSIEQSSGTDAAIDWLKQARFRGGKDQMSATNLGTVVHGLAENYALTGHRPDQGDVEDAIRRQGKTTAAMVKAETPVVMAMVGQFDRWCDAFQPSYQAAEVTVYSPTYGYAGTCDAFLTVDGIPFIADYKTSRKSFDGKGNPTGPYPEVSLQLAAYRFAELAAVWRPRRFEEFRRRYYLLGEAEKEMAQPVPEVETGLVIHITPEHCDAYPVRCDRDVHTAFLYVLEAARWAFQTSRGVIGPALTPPAGAAA